MAENLPAGAGEQTILQLKCCHTKSLNKTETPNISFF